jgi:arginyl-tRNA synthetase
MFNQERQALEADIQTYCFENHLPNPGEIHWNPIPFTGEWGISTSFFQLAAQEARSGTKIDVPQRANELAASIAKYIGTPAGFSHVEVIKGYLNLYYETADYSQRVVDTVLCEGVDFGRGTPKGERVMVEYAQPNTHHSFHIGHYRNSILGESVARIVNFAGFDTIRASYPGDIGLGVITVLWMYDKFYQGQEPEGVHDRGQWLLKLYVEGTNLLTESEDESPEETAKRKAFDAERREMLRKWDNGDPYVRNLWLATRAWSLDELKDILDMLNIDIDVWFFESEVDEPAKEIVDELIELGIADDERPEGAVIVKIDEKLGLKKEKYRTNVILRNDGTTLYLTKDLALAKVKFEKYHVDRSVYVIDIRQSLHMQQTFAILKLWGFPQADKCFHLGYGFVSLPGGAMSARRGRVVLFKDVVDEAVRRVLAEIEQKNPIMPAAEKQDVALKVGLGALAFAMLSVDNNKDIVFDIDEALNFEGHTGPYIQYAHVRATSILGRFGEPLPDSVTPTYSLDPTEVQLIDIISQFPMVVQRAAELYKPLQISNLAYDLARAFNDFYNKCPVLQSDPEVRAFRLRLVTASRIAIANALNLLDIAAPNIM